MHDTLDFANHKDTLKPIKLQSRQAEILTLMLEDVCASCKFIKTYVEDSQRTLSLSASLALANILFAVKRTLKNVIGGGLDKTIKGLSDALVERRRAFLEQATVSTQNTVSEILDELEKMSTKVSDVGRWFLMTSGLPTLTCHRTRGIYQSNPIRIQPTI